MVILMGVRLDRYREEKERKHRKFHNFLRITIVVAMFLCLGFAISYVNSTIEDLNYLDNTTLFDVNRPEGKFTILGKTYIIELDKILDIIKPD